MSAAPSAEALAFLKMLSDGVEGGLTHTAAAEIADALEMVIPAEDRHRAATRVIDDSAETSAYKVGDAVFAHWKGSMYKKFFPGNITAVSRVSAEKRQSINEAAERDIRSRTINRTAGPKATQFPDRFPGGPWQGPWVYDILFTDGDTNQDVPEQAIKPRSDDQTKPHSVADAARYGYDLGVKGYFASEQKRRRVVVVRP
ncbi:hypothetical protein FNF28_06939 [Cafeteria roenbergensis]|uniref:Uncharacterized protein n=1 Tax=Cafeteria roenbergensis TaxID=33653 RepID=A0A5A8CM27_CAFRO|nr:hypothetical protein FNF28_06939 [Cafeteria roenbergensis]